MVRRGYVHGDLRSPNVFVASDGHAKVGDFGLAQILGEQTCRQLFGLWP